MINLVLWVNINSITERKMIQNLIKSSQVFLCHTNMWSIYWKINIKIYIEKRKACKNWLTSQSSLHKHYIYYLSYFVYDGDLSQALSPISIARIRASRHNKQLISLSFYFILYMEKTFTKIIYFLNHIQFSNGLFGTFHLVFLVI